MRRYTLHIILFILTVASTCFVGGPVYSAAIILILLGHEMGHYLMARRYGIMATLPFFLPFPVQPLGTLGAVIRMKSAVSSRKALFDTGIAGPLISFIFSLPAIVIGLKFSKIIPLAGIKTEGFSLGDSLTFSFIQNLILGKVPKNYDVVLHPLAFAGWVGLFVTSLNLLPIGQLDGGHIVYGLFGRKSRIIYFVAMIAMAFITVFFNPQWWLLLILIILFGFRHPPPMDDQTPLDWKRRILGGVILLVFLLSFIPVPFPGLAEEMKQAIHLLFNSLQKILYHGTTSKFL
jgi:membrane-associated protease RseP (regulator of RpoE activity)